MKKNIIYIDGSEELFERILDIKELDDDFDLIHINSLIECVDVNRKNVSENRGKYHNTVFMTDIPNWNYDYVVSNNVINCIGKSDEAIVNELNWICSDFGREINNGDFNTFVTSDTHFNHGKIIEYCNRPFSDVEEMNEKIIENWNSVVGKNDIVWHLGDFALGDKKKIPELVNRLNGRINLVMGNHDHNKIGFYYDAGFHRVYDRKVIIQDYIILSHAPMEFVKQPWFNIAGHVHDCSMYNTLSENGCIVCMERWNYKPVSLDEIKNTWKKKFGND